MRHKLKRCLFTYMFLTSPLVFLLLYILNKCYEINDSHVINALFPFNTLITIIQYSTQTSYFTMTIDKFILTTFSSVLIWWTKWSVIWITKISNKHLIYTKVQHIIWGSIMYCNFRYMIIIGKKFIIDMTFWREKKSAYKPKRII